MNDDLKENILAPGQWLRILYMAFFGVVCWLLGIILSVLIVAQALFSLITGTDNPNLRRLGGVLGMYFFQVLQFLTYNSQDKPFPFADFPVVDEAGNEAPGSRQATPASDADAGSDVFADISFGSGHNNTDEDAGNSGEQDDRNDKEPNRE
ncbi:MAG: DUF4389 domain-containing protein [Pseudomonadales bacterium]|nr:DUF4389 domain-containing protein [Pseudomonadales bacterium]